MVPYLRGIHVRDTKVELAQRSVVLSTSEEFVIPIANVDLLFVVQATSERSQSGEADGYLRNERHTTGE